MKLALLILTLAVATSAFGAQPAVTYNSVTRVTSPSDAKLKGNTLDVTGGITADTVTPTNGVMFGGIGGLVIDGSSDGIQLNSGSAGTTNIGPLRVTADLRLDGTITDGAGSVGTANQVLKSGGAGVDATWGSPGGYVIHMSWGSSSLTANGTFYGGWGAVALGSGSQGRYVTVVPRAGVLRGYTLHLYGAAGTVSQPVTTSLTLNNGSSLGSDAFDWITFPINRSAQANTLNQVVAVGDLLEVKVITPNPWTTPATGVIGILAVYIEEL